MDSCLGKKEGQVLQTIIKARSEFKDSRVFIVHFIEGNVNVKKPFPGKVLENWKSKLKISKLSFRNPPPVDVRNPGTKIGYWMPDMDCLSSGMTFEAVFCLYQSLLKGNILPLIVEEVSKKQGVFLLLFPEQELDTLSYHESCDECGSKGRVSKIFLNALPSRSIDVA